MRGLLRASDTALALARRLAILAIAVVVPAFGCGHAAVRHPRSVPPPPNVLLVGLEPVALRMTAWVELHAWLAAAGREGARLSDGEIDRSAASYATILAGDERDESLGQTARALGACDDERCARAAVTGTPFATAYLGALPVFLEKHWTARATRARAGVELVRAAAGEELRPLVDRLAHDLAIDWPVPAAVVDVVGDAPAPGRDAPIRVLLAARGSCFAAERRETIRMHDARIIDCVLAYAALRLDGRSALASALEEALRAAGRADETTRAWTALVVHAVAQIVTGLEPKHTSVLRRSAAVVLPEAMAWLAREWPSRMRGEPVATFAKRYAEAFASVASDSDR